MRHLLEVDQLHVTFKTYGGEVQAVRGVSFTLARGETLAIVGESGCGKSVTARSIMRIIPEPPGRIKRGSILYKGTDLAKLSDRQMRKIRGREIAMIFQDPMTSLNPTIKVGEQLIEGLIRHRAISRKDARNEVLKYLEQVGIPYPAERLKQYPHQFSGGMRQRLMIAMALITQPSILIADEPTTALDVTIQAQMIELFKKIQVETGVSIIMITHDLGVVAQIADRVSVMYAGKILESGSVKHIFKNPQHPYTKGLLESIPRLDKSRNKPLVTIPGSPPDLFAPPQGCPFVDRCPYGMKVCQQYEPPVTEVNGHHAVSCWLQDERARRLIGIRGGGAGG